MCGIALLAVIMLYACKDNKPTNTYTINGTAIGLADGDTLLITDSNGVPIDNIVIKDGKFSYTGSADSVCCYALNVVKDQFNSLLFFTEPGNITITVASNPTKSKVAGTVSNDALQLLMEATDPYYEKIHEIEMLAYSDTTLTHEQEWALSQRYQQLYSEIENRCKEAAEQNIENELGYMLVVRNIDEQENSELILRLIAAMPEKFRQRQPIIELQDRLTARHSTDEGQQMPDFTMATPDGDSISIMSKVQENKITVLDFWASWCGPCREEMPFMRQLYDTYHPKGMGIVGISLDDSKAAWTQAISSLRIEWAHMSDLRGWNNEAAQLFHVTAIPYTVVVDSLGNILRKGLRGETLEQYVASVFEQ
jgi:thiol-disulfide isomerase/thioredoxin